MITDGGFEQATGNGNNTPPPGWNTIVNSYGAYNGIKHSGIYGLHVGAGSHSGGEYQDVTTVPGLGYQLTFWAVGWTAGGTQQIIVQVGTPGPVATSLAQNNNAQYVNQTNTVPLYTGAASWVQFTYNFTATSTTTRVSFQNYAPNNDSACNIDDVSLVPTGAPAITTQPASLAVEFGDDAAFSATASGVQPLCYQWFFAGSPLANQTNTTLLLTNVATNQAGNYFVVVSNSVGITTSAVATLAVSFTGLIRNGGFEANSGTRTLPTGWSLVTNSYGAYNGTGNGMIAHTGAWFLHPGASSQSGGEYQDIATGPGRQYTLAFWAVGWTAGNPHQLIVQAGTPGPAATSLAQNNNAEYLNQTNTLPTYTSPASWTQFTYSFTPTSTVTRISFQSYSPSGTTSVNVDDVTVFPPPGVLEILRQPSGLEAVRGGDATFRTLAIGTAPLSYQWLQGTNALPGATNALLALRAVTSAQAGDYRVVASDTSGSVTSQVATLTVTDSLIRNGGFEQNGGNGTIPTYWSNIVNSYGAYDFNNGSPHGGSYVMHPGANSGSGGEYQDATTTIGQAYLLTFFAVGWPDGPASQSGLVQVGTPGSSATSLTLNNNAEYVTAAFRVPNWTGNESWTGFNQLFVVTSATMRVSFQNVNPSATYHSAINIDDVSLVASAPLLILTQPQSQAVTELDPAAFSITALAANGASPLGYQWLCGGAVLSRETNRTLNLPVVSLTDSNAQFACVVTSLMNSTPLAATSQVATLTVLASTNSPVVRRVLNAGLTHVTVDFSKALNVASATALSNYTLSGVNIFSASLSADGRTVTLATDSLILDQEYTLTVSNVIDRAATPNLIAPNPTIVFFRASPFTIADIGSPATLGTLGGASGGYDFTAGGSGVGGSNDQFSFAFENRVGDFDAQVRLGALGLSDAWASAGLMARDGLATNAVFAATFATPGPAGCFFQSRTNTGATALRTGSFPVNYPDTWLRLRRTGSVFDGFASLDGATWAFLGSATITMSSNAQVGFALGAAGTSVSTTAQFREFGAGAGVIVTNPPLPFEPMGPSSRRTGLVFSEIMFNPPDAWASNNLQFVEIYNASDVFDDLSGYRLDGDIGFTFPPGTVLPAGGYLVVAKNPVALQAFYGLSSVLGPFSGNLPNKGGKLQLFNELSGLMLEVNYDNSAPWPVAADGTGHSLVLRRPSYGENDPRAWDASDVIGGSPGHADAWGREPLRGVVINEFLANSDAPGVVDFIELYNAGNSSVDLSSCWLSDDPATNKFRIPDSTTLGPRGFTSFTETQLGFALSSDGDQIYLVNSNRTRVLDAVRFGAQAPDVSRGRLPDGSPCWSELASPTPGTTNSPLLQCPIVINEIMYHPISDDSADEFVELFNRGTNSVDLLGWRLSDGISFEFTNSVVVPPGGYTVVANNLTNLLAKYTNLTTANTFGNYGGALKNSGERIALQMPVEIVKTNGAGGFITNIAHATISEVTYGTGGRWGRWSDGGGSSLELVDPCADNRFAANWADSDESAKAPWTTVEFTGSLVNGMTTSYGTPDRVEMFLQGPGECLVDDVECFQTNEANRVSNSSFESGATGWNVGGTQRGSLVEAGVGVTGSALHIVATERGDTGANKIRTAITAMTTGTSATLRAKARWLKGDPYLLLRLRGNWLEATARLNIPANLGTPGLPNSRLVANAGPAIADATHAPVLPVAGQLVVVSARVDDPDGISAVTLRYRLDSATAYTSVPMTDDGSGGDVLAGDGIFSATVPGQASGTLVAFYITATDAAAAPANRAFPTDAPARECLVRWGETTEPGSLGTYHFWITQSNANFWATREANANDGVDCTFTYANSRVMYNVPAHYKGSPAHTVNYTGPLGATCDYVVTFPADDLFLGAEDVVLGGEDIAMPYFIQADNTAQVEVAGFWIARKLGQSFSHTRFVHLFFNGQRRATIYRDMQQPTDLVDEFIPGGNGNDVRKVEHWFEFDDAAVAYQFTGASLEKFPAPDGTVDAKRYRWNWRPRASTGPTDFTNIIGAVVAANTPGYGSDYTSNVLAWLDVRGFLRPIAVHHIVGNWDSYAYTEGHNVYACKPDALPWRLLLWDLDFALGSRSSRSTTEDIFVCNEPVVARMFSHAPFRREYLAAMLDAVNGPLAPGAADPSLDAQYASFQQNGLPVSSPASIKNYMAARRAYLLKQIPAADFRVTAPASTETNVVTLTGIAPLNAASIRVNGRALSLIWATVTNWSGDVLVAAGTNQLAVTAYDFSGTLLAATNLTLAFTGTNAWPPLRINEWMASNTGFIRDPADNNTDDWFEIFNPTVSAVNLRGWSLTDTPTNTARFVVPADYILPAGGFLLVWADSEPQQNSTNRADLHVDFKLDKNGEAIGLFAPDGTLMDAVTFGQQTNNVSQGRWPDGGSNLVFLTTPTPGTTNPEPVRTVTGQVELDGYVGLSNSGVGTRLVTFKATDNAGTILRQWNLTLNLARGASGYGVASFTLTNVPSTATHFSAKTAWNLRKRIAIAFSGGQALADFTGNNRLPGGDIDGSNMVDFGDFNQLAAFWYTTDADSDINDSGLVDIEDYFLLASRWYQEGDAE